MHLHTMVLLPPMLQPLLDSSGFELFIGSPVAVLNPIQPQNFEFGLVGENHSIPMFPPPIFVHICPVHALPAMTGMAELHNPSMLRRWELSGTRAMQRHCDQHPTVCLKLHV
jgi:hypothetical protein